MSIASIYAPARVSAWRKFLSSFLTASLSKTIFRASLLIIFAEIITALSTLCNLGSFSSSRLETDSPTAKSTFTPPRTAWSCSLTDDHLKSVSMLIFSPHNFQRPPQDTSVQFRTA
ncbi:hypothetical protein LA080_014246 [Diaporthe eres]|nr:hypothetical protein LA080_014246 [Diaporthe eres]